MTAQSSTSGARPAILALLAGAQLAALATGPAAARDIAWQQPVEIAAGEAFQGAWRMNESDFRYVDDPAVAISRKGDVAVAWVDQSRKDIFFQLYGSDGRARLPAPLNVSRSPRVFSWMPRIVIRSVDPIEVHVLWQEIVFSGGSHGGEIFFSRSTDGGRTFSAPLNLSNSRAGDGKGRLGAELWHNGSLDLAIGRDGVLHAAWTEYEGALWFSRSTDGGRRFSPPRQAAGGANDRPARAPTLAVDGGKSVYLAWSVGDDPEAAIRFARSSDSGRTFGTPASPFSGGGHADAPKLAVDARGVVHLVYAHSPAARPGHYRILYSRSPDGGRMFESPREISATQQAASAHFPSLGVDGRNGVHVVWETFENPRLRPRGLGFTSSADGGGAFAPPAEVPGSVEPDAQANGSLQGLLMRKLAVDDSGALAIVNSTFRIDAPGRSRIRLIRGQAGPR